MIVTILLICNLYNTRRARPMNSYSNYTSAWDFLTFDWHADVQPLSNSSITADRMCCPVGCRRAYLKKSILAAGDQVFPVITDFESLNCTRERSFQASNRASVEAFKIIDFPVISGRNVRKITDTAPILHPGSETAEVGPGKKNHSK